MRRWRTYIIVTAFSALIWIFAEAESVRTAAITVDVTFESAGSGSGVHVDPDERGWSGRVSIEMTGTAASIARARDRLPGQLTLRLGREVTAEPGRQIVDLRGVLRELPEIEEAAVSIVGAAPATVELEIARYVELPVRVDALVPGESGRATAAVEPARAVLRLPEELAESLGENPVVAARVPEASLRGLGPGQTTVIPGVGIEIPVQIANRGWAIAVEPEAVRIRLTRRAVTDRVVLPAVPVHLRVGSLDFNRWDVSIADLDQVLRDVVLSGPADAIRRIRDREIAVIATLALSFEDLEQGITSKRAEILGLPAGVTATVEDPEVSIEIRRRAGADG